MKSLEVGVPEPEAVSYKLKLPRPKSSLLFQLSLEKLNNQLIYIFHFHGKMSILKLLDESEVLTDYKIN